MGLENREYRADTSYQFGFNGKEKDDEVQGGDNTYDYGFRIYNSRLGKFISTDPLTVAYPWYTPYQFAGNMPIWAIDLDGLEELKATKKMVISTPDNKPINYRGQVITPGTYLLEQGDPTAPIEVEHVGYVQGPYGYNERRSNSTELPSPPKPPVNNLVQRNEQEGVVTSGTNAGSGAIVLPPEVSRVPSRRTSNENIQFEAGSPTLTVAGKETISKIADRAPNNSTGPVAGAPAMTPTGVTQTTTEKEVSSVIVINLSTDRKGPWADQLLENRLMAIARELVEQGVPANKIQRGTLRTGVMPSAMGGNVNATNISIETLTITTKTTTVLLPLLPAPTPSDSAKVAQPSDSTNSTP